MIKLVLTIVICLTVTATIHGGDTPKKNKRSSSGKSKLFDSSTLKCLVCQSMVDEFKYSIDKVDPRKTIETGSFRVDGNGEQAKISIPYARSQVHLMEVVDQVCKNFEDYAQAKVKKTGKPTIIRLMTPQGNMNPEFGNVDIVPDEDLNTKLKFHCESIVEDMEDHLTSLFAKDPEPADIKDQICYERSKYCKKKKEKKEEL